MKNTEYENVSALVKKYKALLDSVPDDIKNQAFDIRLKSGQPLAICAKSGIYYIKDIGRVSKNAESDIIICSESDIKEVFLHICAHSVFSHENEIKNGFVSVNSSYRAGICGTAVTEDGKITNVKDISSIVLRIPREIRGCANKLFGKNINFTKGILIVGEPSSGKTTFLRDLTASLSWGRYTSPKRIAVLDERGEIEGSFNLGPMADILNGYPKQEGFNCAIRMLSPEIIVCDELSDMDLEIVSKSVFSGVGIIATVHSTQMDFLKRPLCKKLVESGAFETIAFLRSRGYPSEIERICSVGDVYESNRNDFYNSQQFDTGCDEIKCTEKKRNDVA